MIRQICVERSHWGLSRHATGLPFFPPVHKIDLERGIKAGFKWVLLNFFTSRILFSPFYQNNLYNFIFKCCSYPHDEFGQGNKLFFFFHLNHGCFASISPCNTGDLEVEGGGIHHIWILEDKSTRPISLTSSQDVPLSSCPPFLFNIVASFLEKKGVFEQDSH